eukprot:5728755-Heterocapsa_arctica.AAC.1
MSSSCIFCSSCAVLSFDPVPVGIVAPGPGLHVVHHQLHGIIDEDCVLHLFHQLAVHVHELVDIVL